MRKKFKFSVFAILFISLLLISQDAYFASNAYAKTVKGRTTTKPTTTTTTTTPTTPTTTPITQILYDTFESSTISSTWDKEFSTSYGGTISKTTAAGGVSSFRSELRRTDPDTNGSKRAELAYYRTEQPLEEHWYAASIYLPSSASEDYAIDKNSPESIIQWHNSPDPGETWTSPPLWLETLNGDYKVVRRWDDAKISTNASMDSKGYYSETDIGSYSQDKGKWVRWVFHVKWGWLESQGPKLEIFKDGVKVYEANGMPNMMNDEKGVYMKFGVYKWDWSSNPTRSTLDKRVVYYDNVSIDNAADRSL